MGYIGKENRFCFSGIFLEFDIVISLRLRRFGLLLGRARLSVLLGGVDKEIDDICRGVFTFEELRLLIPETVVERIPHATIVHFACHGVSDRANSFESHLLLQKAGELEPIGDLNGRTQDTPKVIFLSACFSRHG
jgi:hypothetical protein